MNAVEELLFGNVFEKVKSKFISWFVIPKQFGPRMFRLFFSILFFSFFCNVEFFSSPNPAEIIIIFFIFFFMHWSIVFRTNSFGIAITARSIFFGYLNIEA